MDNTETPEPQKPGQFAGAHGSAAGIFDKTHRTPVDQTAARVIKPGIRHTPYGKGTVSHIFHSENCPALMNPAKLRDLLTTPNLTGRKVGRLTVMGMARDIKGKEDTGGRWVVRCACGDYEVRTAKAINNPKNTEDTCRICGKARQTKHFREYIECGGVKPPNDRGQARRENQ